MIAKWMVYSRNYIEQQLSPKAVVGQAHQQKFIFFSAVSF
jgi:hypothetical protein